MERAQGHTRRALLADPGGDQHLACMFGGVPIYMVNTRRTPSRPRPCHPRKLDEAMATSLRDCGFYSSSVRILVWPCFFFCVCFFDARHWSNRRIAHPRVLAAAREARAYWRSVRGI